LLLGALLWLRAEALIPADVLLERARASKVLDAGQRALAHELADHAEIVTTPEDYQHQVEAAQPDLSRARAFFYYSAVAHLERREKVLLAYAVRRDQSVQAVEELHKYERRCRDRLRGDDFSDAYSIVKWPGENDAAAFEFRVSDEGLHVFHFLPWPDHLEHGLAERALALAEEDMRLCQADQEKVEKARQVYLKAHVLWLRWTDRLCKEITPLSEALLKSETITPK